MDGPKAPNQIARINPHNLSIRKKISQDIERYPVIRIIKHRNQNQSIRDIEVPIAGWYPCSIKQDRGGERQLDNRQLVAVLVSGLSQAADVVPQRLIVGVFRIRLYDCDNRIGATKRVMSSTCPCVSSPAMPAPSQTTFLIPKVSAKTFS